MRTSSTLVNVSSVTRRPTASVVRPLQAARSGTPKPAVQIVTALGSVRPPLSWTASPVTAVTVAPTPCKTVTPSAAIRRATARRPRGCRYGPSTSPHTRVTARPASASSAAVSMPVGPAPTTVTGAVSGVAPSTGRSRCASSREAIGYACSAAPGARVGAVAAHGVDQVVVVHRGARRQRHAPLGHVDPDHGVDHQPDAVGEDLSGSRRPRRRTRRPAGAGGSARRRSLAG